MHLTLCATLLAAGAFALEARASPVVSDDGESRPATLRSDESLAEPAPVFPAGAQPADRQLPPALPETEGLRIGDGEIAYRPRSVVALPENYGVTFGQGNPFGQGESLRSQLLRDFVDPFAQPQSPGTAASRRAAQDPVSPEQAAIRTAVDDVLKLMRETILEEDDTVQFYMAGVEFSFAVGEGRSSLTANGSEPWPALINPVLEELRFDAAGKPSAMHAGRGAPATAGRIAQQDSDPARMSDAPGGVPVMPLVLSKLQDFATDPLILIPTLTGLLLWLAFEFSTAIRERRQWRRLQRRAARARG